ncbi:hypothetical protein LINPERHAP1_LOCUS33575 [Linum perenne]
MNGNLALQVQSPVSSQTKIRESPVSSYVTGYYAWKGVFEFPGNETSESI